MEGGNGFIGGAPGWGKGRDEFPWEAPGAAPTPHFAARAQLHSAVVEMVAVLLQATLHPQGQHPG